MKHNLILVLLALGLSGSMAGKVVSPDEALQRLAPSAPRALKSNAAPPRYLHAINDPDGEAAIYLFTFSGDDGFMLLSAEDAVKPLLGYSETGTFSLSGLPENIVSWMNFYTGQIADARGCDPYVAPLQTRGADNQAIAPMLQTTWDQTAPFNNLCPVQGNRKSVTGCVATAMAQVMKYWEYPLKGKGTVAYRPESLDVDLTFDYASTTFDWDNMLNSYDGGYSATTAHAVAVLMQACGYGVKMEYGSGSSGALSRDIPAAMTTYFGYDSGIARKVRSNYRSQDEWNQLVYDQLKNVGPVIYSGQSVSGGHCFVCDGYDGNGYYHINWGWSGLSDGYFTLDELTPSSVGTGGHYGGYNMSQDVVVGITPPVGRLELVNLSIDNAADDSGNVKGWGYTYRIMNFSNILVNASVRISGGHVTSPLYVTIYDTDPDTKKNLSVEYESTFEENLHASEGVASLQTYAHLYNYDPSKLYTLVLSYDLKGQRSTIGSVRLAASSGVDDVIGECCELRLWQEGEKVRAESPETAALVLYDLSGRKAAASMGVTPEISLEGLMPGVYIAVARDSAGREKSLKLHLR